MTDLAAEITSQRLRRARSSWSLLLRVLAAGLLLCQVIIWYQPQTPLLAVLDQFAIQLAGLAVLAAVCALLSRRWLCLVLLAALAATLSWPIFAERGEAATVTDPARLKVLSVNLWHSAAGHQRTIDALLASDADVMGLIEVTPAWRAVLGPLFAKYPYQVECFDRDPECLTMLLSKVPIEKSFAGRIWKATPIVASGEILWQGRPVTVLAAHWFRPVVTSADSRWGAKDPKRAAYMAEGLPLSRQAGQAGLLAKYLNRQPRDLILMGDLNSVPWSRVQRAFRARTGLDNQAGWSSSWPSFLPWPLRLPIDHILARGHLVVTKFSTGPETDSDHFPVVAEIGWRD
ncbi:endonuclease/exonuclease/phosphatase family protein [Dongia deserti]|uniref:endonuclease/exonuclease/phosphatase family protein n=1 Tax=Dongia deserti TaxID=2268030 RepID=UPI000E65A56D|nr:endonuclease/exonuclease/phosphatase family protein [Dongia deserti]